MVRVTRCMENPSACKTFLHPHPMKSIAKEWCHFSIHCPDLNRHNPAIFFVSLNVAVASVRKLETPNGSKNQVDRGKDSVFAVLGPTTVPTPSSSVCKRLDCSTQPSTSSVPMTTLVTIEAAVAAHATWSMPTIVHPHRQVPLQNTETWDERPQRPTTGSKSSIQPSPNTSRGIQSSTPSPIACQPVNAWCATCTQAPTSSIPT